MLLLFLEDTCFLHSTSTSTESQYKRRGALQDPQEDFEVILSRQDFKDQYEKVSIQRSLNAKAYCILWHQSTVTPFCCCVQKHGPIGGEKEEHTGFTRLTNSLEILKREGVPGYKGKVTTYKFWSISEGCYNVSYFLHRHMFLLSKAPSTYLLFFS
jgi:hypothetical protein